MSNKNESLALRTYRRNIFNIIIITTPLLCLFAAILYTTLKVIGFIPSVKWGSLIVFDILNILYVIFGCKLSKLGKKEIDQIKFDKIYSLGKIAYVIVLLVQYNFIYYMIPCTDFWGFAFVFCLASALFLDLRTFLITISGITLSTFGAWILRPELLLPESNEYFIINIIDRITCFVITMPSFIFFITNIKKYLINLWSDEYNEDTGLLEVKLGVEEVARKEAEHLNESKTAFIKQISHEIRTPINIMLGMNQMMEKDICDGTLTNQSALDYSRNISMAGNTLLSLINSMIDINKIEAGEIKVNEENYPMQLLLKDIIHDLVQRAKAKGLQAVINVDENIPRGLCGDSKLITNVLNNIISNAIKYTKDGFVNLTVSLVENKNGIATIRYSVSDSGIGMKENVIKKINQNFADATNKVDFSISGTGLGITIAETYLKMMKSTMNIQSVYGKGSTFSFDLDQKIIDGNKMGKIKDTTISNSLSQNEYIQRFETKNARILIVDDVEMNLKIAQGLINHLGLTIDLCLSGKEAIEKCSRFNYDIIFMDQMMPEMDGIAATKEIRKLSEYYEKVPVIALTANVLSGAKEEILQNGLNDYLTKPIQRLDFEDTIKKWLPNEKITVLIEDTKEEIKDEQEYDEIIDNTLDSIIPEIDEIDKEEALTNLGSEKAYKNALLNFLEIVDESLIMIQNSVISLDNEMLKQELNDLIRMLKIIGAERIYGNCEYLEANCDELTSYEIKMKAAEIIERVLKLKENITRVISYEENISYATSEELKD